MVTASTPCQALSHSTDVYTGQQRLFFLKLASPATPEMTSSREPGSGVTMTSPLLSVAAKESPAAPPSVLMDRVRALSPIARVLKVRVARVKLEGCNSSK